MSKIESTVNSFLKEQGSCTETISQNISDIVNIIDMLILARDNCNKVFTMGNGGSASTASSSSTVLT